MLESSWKLLWIIQLIFLIGVLGSIERWDGVADQELEDEKHDTEILKAVMTSIAQWKSRRQNKTRHKRAEQSVCYPELGCFDASGPFGYLDALPSSPDEISTTFVLYPGRRRARSVTLGDTPLLEVPFENLTGAWQWASKGGFNTSLPTKILVHGFGSSCSHIWVYEMRSALMSVEDCNIVCVDWENGAVLPNYVKAAANTRLVGKQLAMLLKGLENHVGISRNSMHLIGFSLGAHVAGFAGTELRNISRITGLDPAGPLFESQDPVARLDSTDADFVDVIHSNGENLILGGLGSWQPMGHVDFYPNGGRMQNGCSNLFVGAFTDIIWSSAVEGRSLCNHRRAYKFFTDSVSPRCQFPAFPCETYEDFLAGKCFPCTGKNCGNMGYYADRSSGRGQLFLVTRDEEPFCAHQYSVKIESSPSKKPVINYGKIKITLVGDTLLNESFTMTKKDDEQLIPGDTMSKILVPHPIISEITKIQILYQGYSGWLSSGLRKWKIDKVSIMDSSGKVSTVCRKGLELESGVPITLPLYPGDCRISVNDTSTTEKTMEDRVFSLDKNKKKTQHANEIGNNSSENGFIPLEPLRKFIPTPVVKIGNEAIKADHRRITTLQETIKNGNKASDRNSVYYQWQPVKDPADVRNELDDSNGSNRAFNTKSVRSRKDTVPVSQQERVKEIAEPILKKPTKNARAHDINKPEITEPILGPTTAKIITVTTEKPPSLLSKIVREKKDFEYYVKDERQSEWVPTNVEPPTNLKGFESFKSISIEETKKKQDDNNPLRVIMMTVQFLPERLSKMFENAEKYARETLFPLISQHTPKFISNFIVPKDNNQPLYVPLDRSESTTKPTSGRSSKESTPNVVKTNFSPPDVPVSLSRTDLASLTDENKKNVSVAAKKNETTTSLNETARSGNKEAEKIQLVYPQKDRKSAELTSSTVHPVEPKVENGYEEYYEDGTTEKSSAMSTTTENSRAVRLYVDLPVFDERDKGIKYIPLQYTDALKVTERITKR